MIGHLNHGDVTFAEWLGEDTGGTVHPRQAIAKGGTQLLAIGQPLVGKTGGPAQEPKPPTGADPDGLLDLNFRHAIFV